MRVEESAALLKQVQPGLKLLNGLGQVQEVKFSESYTFAPSSSSGGGGGGGGLSGGEIAGIVIGSVVGGVVVLGVLAVTGVVLASKLRQGSEVGSGVSMKQRVTA